MRGNVSLFMVAVVIALVVIANTCFTVNEMEQAVVLQLGAPKAVINSSAGKKNEAGLHFKMPFFQNVVRFDKRLLSADQASIEVPDQERNRLVIDAFVRYRIVDPLKFYQTLHTEEQGQVRMLSLLQSALYNEMGTTTIFTVLSEERGTVMAAVRNSVNEAASRQFGIQVVDVRIRRADLPQQNRDSIIARMVAEREREAAQARAEGDQIKNTIQSQADRERTVILAEATRQAEIIRGEGDAERNRIYAAAYTKDPDFFAFYRSMEAYKQALGHQDTTMVISPDSEFFKFLGTDKGK